jgi:hypothetical protein
MPRTQKQFGITLERRVSLQTEEAEPLLLLADFAAGIVHASLLPEAAEHLPLSQEQALALRVRLEDAGLLALFAEDFDVDAQAIYGELATDDRAENGVS